MKKLIISIISILLLVTTVHAKRGSSGGGFRGSSPSRSKSTWGNKSKSSTSTKKTKSKTNTIKSKTNTKKTKTKSKADKQLAKKAKASGKYHKNRKSAVKDFRAKNKGKYTSKYKKKPNKRPDHIPNTTKVNNTTVNINYNPAYGGYGYMMGGSWMLYDAMADVVMMNMLMSRQGYYIESDRVVHVHNDGCFINFMEE